MTRKEKHTDRIASRSCSIDQSHVVVVVANLFFIRRVREIPRRRRRRVGRRKRPTHRRRRQSQNRSRSSTRARDEDEYDATRAHENERTRAYPGMTCTNRARSPRRPMARTNHRTHRALTLDASTPTIHVRVLGVVVDITRASSLVLPSFASSSSSPVVVALSRHPSIHVSERVETAVR